MAEEARSIKRQMRDYFQMRRMDHSINMDEEIGSIGDIIHRRRCKLNMDVFGNPNPARKFYTWPQEFNGEADPELNGEADPELNGEADPDLNGEADPTIEIEELNGVLPESPLIPILPVEIDLAELMPASNSNMAEAAGSSGGSQHETMDILSDHEAAGSDQVYSHNKAGLGIAKGSETEEYVGAKYGVQVLPHNKAGLAIAKGGETKDILSDHEAAGSDQVLSHNKVGLAIAKGGETKEFVQAKFGVKVVPVHLPTEDPIVEHDVTSETIEVGMFPDSCEDQVNEK